MKRRHFIGTVLAAGIPGARAASARVTRQTTTLQPCTFQRLPDTLAGMSLQQLRDDYRDRLFNRYLPFWDKGGYDKQLGGFMCELNDDGSVFSDEKYIWYQGRGIWVYSFLYNNFGRDPRFLKIAEKSKDFMVGHMYAGNGKWFEKVRRDGTVMEGGVGKVVYGWLFAAAGLCEFYKATRDQKVLALAKESIWSAVRAYDDPDYAHGDVTHIGVETPKKGLRFQGHSMVLIRILSQLLSYHDDPRLEKLQREQVKLVMNKFWNPEYGIVNECLQHDYSRIPGTEAHMFAGHSLETQWMIMVDALRTKDRVLFRKAKDRVRRLLEICWDYLFEGWADEDFFAVDTPEHRRGPTYEIKTMWAQCEVLVACMMILEYTGEVWAKEWYERARAFTLRTMPVEGHGVWRQAVDRRGKNIKREGISSKRKGNFHQPRMMMLNLLSLERMIANRDKCTPFP